MTELKTGDKAPDFALQDQHGALRRLADYAGRKLVLYVYPKADTPGCTTQSCALRDARAGWLSHGLAVVGISPDQPAAQLAFDRKFDLGFTLLADPDHAVAEAYGAWGEKVRDGKTTVGIIRSAFLIDERGRIAQAWYKVAPEATVPAVEAALNGPPVAAVRAPGHC